MMMMMQGAYSQLYPTNTIEEIIGIKSIIINNIKKIVIRSSIIAKSKYRRGV